MERAAGSSGPDAGKVALRGGLFPSFRKQVHNDDEGLPAPKGKEAALGEPTTCRRLEMDGSPLSLCGCSQTTSYAGGRCARGRLMPSYVVQASLADQGIKAGAKKSAPYLGGR